MQSSLNRRQFLATTALAAVVIGAVVRLIEVRSLANLWRSDRFGFVTAISTTVGAVAFGLLQGIVIGVALSLLSTVPRGSRCHACRTAGERI